MCKSFSYKFPNAVTFTQETAWRRTKYNMYCFIAGL